MEKGQLYVICGLIGSGKTTYARTNFSAVTDLDYIPSRDKRDQIALTKLLLQRGEKVAHITCYPTPLERAFFDSVGATYIWIKCSEEQAKRNILKRARGRDMENLRDVLRANKMYKDHLRMTSIDFTFVER